MIHTRSILLGVAALTLLWGLSVDAQTTGRNSSMQNRQTSPAFGASATGTTSGARQPAAGNAASVASGIAEGLQGFAAGVPTLQEAQQLRDTQLRGEFIGAEARTMLEAAGGSQAGTGRQGAGARPNIRIQPVRQPGTQAGQAGRFGQQAGRVMQPTLSLGFSAPPPSSAEVAHKAAQALLRVPSIHNNASVTVRVDGGVATLEGTVGTAHQRALAAQLVSLEPGVTRVDNRLAVGAAEPVLP